MTDIDQLKTKLSAIEQKLDISAKQAQLSTLLPLQQEADFWQNSQRAANVNQQISLLQKEIDQIVQAKKQLADLLELSQLPDLQSDSQLARESSRLSVFLEEQIDSLEQKTYLSGKYDSKFAILSVHAGQGGTEAMDWAAMVQRMYLKYFEKNNWPHQIIDLQAGDEAGIKSVHIQINQPYAYGYLRHEIGAHRLVRLSPFNADNLRQTSFAKVEVAPIFDQQEEIQIRPEDTQFSAFRAGGHGGQNVNKVSTAVRLTHTPSGITVSCQSQRSQQQNRQMAMQILNSKLWAQAEEQRQTTQQQVKGKNINASWGRQIRSYVLHPYKMVKDLRTNYKTGDTSAVLDGYLDEFIKAELKL